MKDERLDGPERISEPDYYQNGQSDVEKLMREHLQTPGHVITDEELKNLKVGVSDNNTATPATHPEAPSEEVEGFGEKEQGKSQSSSWDLLGDS